MPPADQEEGLPGEIERAVAARASPPWHRHPSLTLRRTRWQITRTTHTAGVATVTTVWKQLAEQMCLGLQTYGLTVSIAPDANFNDNNEQAPEA